MWKTKLCMGLSPNFGIPEAEQIKLLQKTGFEGFFNCWTDNAGIKEFRRLADDTGMYYQSVHSPFGKAADMWEKGEKASAALDEQRRCLEGCAENGVPVMVAHVFIGFDRHEPNDDGVKNFEILAREAEKLGVKIAFENTEGEEYLAAVMDNLKQYESVGFCWDTGHEMCYNHSKDMTALYGDRLIATHINDNLGIKDFGGKITWTDDLHLLPFDGIADWDNIAKRLNKVGYDGPLTFELVKSCKPERFDNRIYEKMPIEEYFSEAYKRACRVAALKERL